MIIQGGENSLEVVPIDSVPPHLPGYGDIQFLVQVESEGFTGRVSAWVLAEDLATFVDELRKLVAEGRGSAEIRCMSPDRLRLRFSVINSSGHTSLDGRMGRLGQSLVFDFEFPCTYLPALLAEFTAARTFAKT